jgi:Raf kinase inhibitor-like YbhB/YbcL family protein
MRARRSQVIVVSFVVAALGLAACGGDDDDNSSAASPPSTSGAGGTATTAAGGGDFKLTSTAFQDGQPIPRTFTCQGANTSPPLEWSGVPAGTQQLALIMDDPDAPSGNFVHWVMWSFTPDQGPIAAGKVPLTAIQGNNGSGNEKYTGPCPPSGVHHYQLQLFALSGAPQVPDGAEADQLRSAIDGITIGTTTLVGTYEKS